MTQDVLAGSKAVASVSVAGATWLTDLSLVLQLGATVIAIVAGISAALYHIERYRQIKAKRKK